MKLLQQCFLFFIVVVIPGHNLGNSQVSVNRTIGPTLVFKHLLGKGILSKRRFMIIVRSSEPNKLDMNTVNSIHVRKRSALICSLNPVNLFFIFSSPEPKAHR